MAQQPSGDESEEDFETEDAANIENKGTPPAEAGDEDTDTEEGEDTKDIDDTSNVKIPVRSSYSASEVIARKNRTIAKLKENAGEGAGDDTEEEDEGGALSPEAARAISRGVSKAIRPMAKVLAEKADEGELLELFTANPEAKKYEKRIRAFMSHEAYSAVPPAMIYHHLAAGSIQKTAADKRDKADREAGHSRTGGHPPRGRSASDKLTPQHISDMDEKEFKDLQHKVQTGKLT